MPERERLLRFFWRLYLLLLFLLVAVKFDGSVEELALRMEGGRAANLTPLKTIRLQWQYFSTPWGRRNMLGNIIPFLPLGMLAPSVHLRLRRPRRFFALALCLVTGIELFQFVTALGSFDVDDILLNMAGAAAGYFLLCCRGL